jgi:hypothetical protein
VSERELLKNKILNTLFLFPFLHPLNGETMIKGGIITDIQKAIKASRGKAKFDIVFICISPLELSTAIMTEINCLLYFLTCFAPSH